MQIRKQIIKLDSFGGSIVCVIVGSMFYEFDQNQVWKKKKQRIGIIIFVIAVYILKPVSN